MIESVRSPESPALEFGIYRDGDNNLDASQAYVLKQALDTSGSDHSIAFHVENTTGLRIHGDTLTKGALHTDTFDLTGGEITNAHVGRSADMSSPDNLARFVAQTLDQAERNGAKQTWIELVDHGAGDGGGLESDSRAEVMSMPAIANAIAQGQAEHAREHPEDAGRTVDGVVANQCLMSTLGFADALSRAGVKYLAASPETMISPGTPTSVAHAIAANVDDPAKMAHAVVSTTMRYRYDGGDARFGPAAAFDVLDCSPEKIAHVDAAVKAFNDAAAADARSAPAQRAALREDVASIDGMTRDEDLASQHLPWQADRPAIAMYDTIAHDERLSNSVRAAAAAASSAVGDIVLAHRESAHFTPFNGASYRDAAGPTVHAPVTQRQIDPWAPKISETNNAFAAATDESAFTAAIA